MYDVFAEYEKEKAEQAKRRKQGSSLVDQEQARRKKHVKIWNQYVVPAINWTAAGLAVLLVALLLIAIFGGIATN